MALVKGSTYEGVFYDYVLDGVRDLFISEFSNAKIYIAPKISHADNFQIRIWGPSASTNEWWAESWQKEYDVDIFLYMIEKNPREGFYKQLYGDAERLYQLLHNNKTLSKTVGSTTLAWINGKIDDIDFNDFGEDEEDIDGLNVAKLSFNCLVEREG
tara:strand:- start:340 stop:810 length:471 start_codon:yes stop_codon:yes gene_type:complete